MKASALYEKTLQDYSALLPMLKVSLSKYCKDHRVNYRGLSNWMHENSIPAPKPPRKVQPVLPVTTFSPVTILPPMTSGSPSPAMMLKGVQITLPNGVHVSIGEISGRDMTSLIDSLNSR